MKFSYYGHACFSVEFRGKILLFDPFITPNELASHIKLDQIAADYVLISHGHFDHITDARRNRQTHGRHGCLQFRNRRLAGQARHRKGASDESWRRMDF